MTASDRPPGYDGLAEHQLRRRDLFPLVGAAAAVALLAPTSTVAAQQATSSSAVEAAQPIQPQAAPRYVYVGTYTSPNTAPGGLQPSTSLGVYVFKMDQDGGLTPVQVVPDIPNPSWLTLDRDARFVYVSSEVDTWKGAPNTGGVTAYAVDAGTGKLSMLNEQPTMGSIPAHLSIDPSGKYLLDANYVGATFVVLPINTDGSLGSASHVFPVTGASSDSARQEAPHPHQIQFDPAGKLVFGNDLGTDKVWVWQLDTAAGKLVPNALPYAQVASGSGPRHMAFHPSGKFAYVIDEMVSSITAFKYDATRGALSWMQTVSTIPADFSGTTSCAEIIMHPSGRFVYGSNRGHDSIVGMKIDPTTGLLQSIGWTPTQGGFPRGFNIDPSGALMLVGNQNGDTIVPFRIDAGSGELTPTGKVTSTPVPVCIQFGAVLGAKG